MAKAVMIGKRAKLDWAVLAALMLALPLIVPFLSPGMPSTADGEIHLHRILSAAVNLDAGYLWPRWTPYLHQGYGYAIHNFYAPGVHIVGGAFYLLTHLDPLIILKALMFAAALMYPLGAYRFARTFTGKAGALVAAAAYTYAPFRFHELWVQTNLSQFWAMALLPLLFWAIAKAAARPRRGWVALIGLLFAAVVLLHHPTGFLIAPFAGFYVLALCGRDWRRIVTLSLGLALGLLLSAIFWVPALAELQFTQISRIQEGAFDVVGNLIDLPQLIRLVAPVDRSMLNSPEFYSVGLPQVIAALVGLLALFRARTPLRRNLIFGAFGLVLSIWLITPTSAWGWQHLPIAKLVIYPWRMLGVAALMALPGAAALPNLVPARWRAALAGGLVGVFFAAALPMLYAPLTFYSVPPATPETAILYEQRTGNVGLTSANEYLPAWVTKRPLSVQADAFAAFEWRVDLELDTLPDGVSAERTACGRGATCYAVESPAAFTLIFHQMEFPGLQVTVDGAEVESAPSGESGLLSAPIPAGAHTVSVSYAGTPIQHASEIVSLIALAATGLLLLTAKGRRPEPETDEPGTRALALRVIAVIGGFVLINGLYLTPGTSVFRPASDPSEPPAQHPLSVDFGALELVGYDLSPEPARPGEAIRVRLYWHASQPLASLPRGAVHITALEGRADWGGTESLALGALPPERWTADGYVVDDYHFPLDPAAPPFVAEVRVTLFNADATTTIAVGELRIDGEGRKFAEGTLPLRGAVFGSQIELVAAGLRESDGETCLDLRWSGRSAPLPDYTIMLHLLDGAGNVMAYADAPPFDGLYPTSRWLSRQTLDDSHCFDPGAAVALQLGVYNSADETRLAVTNAEGYTVVNDALQISLK